MINIEQKTNEPDYHVPVMLTESIEGLNIQEDDICVDVTFGGGGHSRVILNHLGKNGKLYVFDQDEDAINNIPSDDRLVFIRSNFRYLKTFLKYYEVESVNSILADLGVSSHHFDDTERGFSYRFEESDLDMRMNQTSSLTATSILNNYEEDKLANVLYLYGELRQSRIIAKSIIKRRNVQIFSKTKDLLEVLEPFCKKEAKDKKILAQVFQALRIEVNNEMDALNEMLMQGKEVLRAGGRFVVITYHSLEDRLVKNFFKTGNFEGQVDQDFFGNINTPFRLINSKVITPTSEEQKNNSRSRSAKLRIAEKK